MKHYLRFADDMLFVSHNKAELQGLIPEIEKFLSNRLKLKLHPDKVILRPLHQGIDFLGYITLPHHRVLRTTTKKRMFRKLGIRHNEFYQGEVAGESLNQSLQSYLGLLSHADTHELSQNVKNIFSWRED